MTIMELVPVEAEIDDDEVHITCCEDYTLALCGGRLYGAFENGVESSTCAVCIDLSHLECCPVAGRESCE